MQYRTDQKSGNKLSILGFGCMRFPKGKEKAEQLVMNAIQQGVNYFDTAYIYPGSEVTLGEILKKNKVRDKVFIATKLPLLLCRCSADFDKYFNKTLERLQTDTIDYYLMHMITDLSLWKKLCSWGIEQWIKEKKASGQIKQIGFSFHGSRDEFLDVLDAYEWEFCQIQYNYSNENYQAGVTGLRKAAEKGIPVIIMEPLLGGKLATGLPKAAVELFEKKNKELSPVAWALRWLWNQPEVTLLLSGMSEDSQLEENCKTAENSGVNMLSDEEHQTFHDVMDIFNDSYKIKCTGCNYCMPCPHHVDIPSCFAAYNTSFVMGKVTALQQYWMSTGSISGVISYASLCKRCGKCEKHCPQSIPIIQSLEEVKKRMEPFWVKAGMSIGRKFLGRSKRK